MLLKKYLPKQDLTVVYFLLKNETNRERKGDNNRVAKLFHPMAPKLLLNYKMF